MKKSLIVVESPTKAKTIGKYLGKGYQVIASVGHIWDLPPSKLGVDVKKKFKPTYQVIKGKDKIIEAIKEAALKADKIFLAPDPDREGEAIAWHVGEELKSHKKKICRIMFNEVTKKAILEALKHPLEINKKKCESQQARRILDRLVGYQISPILWEKVRRGLSAGRVQSVAVKILVDREREIAAFKTVEYWSIDAQLGSSKGEFKAKLLRKNGKKLEIGNGDLAKEIVDELKKNEFKITDVEKSERKRNPQAPFITSRLQQEASRKLRFTAKKTMMVAQQLYEGIELGDAGPTGLITYMRTDSTRISDDALTEVRDFIKSNYGPNYLPEQAIAYKSKKSAQDAHEAVRPTSLAFSPKEVKDFLSPDQVKLYTLIWNRFVACQMVPAILDMTAVDVKAGPYELRATGSIVKFDGFTKVYEEAKDEDAPPESEEESGSQRLPELTKSTPVTLKELFPEQHFTQPPPRFTDASLIRFLEEKGIGRPSTYAAIITNITEKEYVEKDQSGRFKPSELGLLVNDLLVENFKDIVNETFTAGMEDQLDKVEEGEKSWVDVLKDFYAPFKIDLDAAKEKMKNVKAQAIPTEHKCPKCSAVMVIKWGRNGQFLACSSYPECRSTAEFEKKEDGTIELKKAETTDEKCEKCQSPMVVKNGRFGKFLACSAYPECKTTKAISLGLKCPKGCGGEVTSRMSKRGRGFFGCSQYPKCDFVSWDKPVAKPCPSCKGVFLVSKFSQKKGQYIKCPNKECDYEEGPPAESTAS